MMAPKNNRKSAILTIALLLIILLTFFPQSFTAALGINPNVPAIVSPVGSIDSTSPKYEWTKIVGATKYQYQLVKVTTTVLTESVSSTACGTTTCSRTSALKLSPGSYKWRVRALVVGWKSYSAYTYFTVALPKSPAPTKPAVTPSPTAAPAKPATTPSPTAEPTQPASTPSPTVVPINTAASGIHAIGLTYPDYSSSRAVVPQIEQQLKTSGMNLVALNAGRVEWNYFKWAGHESTWSGAVQDTNIDFLADDTARFGQWAHVDAMIDVFAPAYIKAHPDKAAINALGQASPYLVSTVEMVNGEYSQMLLSEIEYIAANYNVDSISLTELQYRVDGYGPDDTASYLAYSGRTDWPRQSNGQPDIDDPSIGNWRSYMIGTLLSKATSIAHKYGKQLFMDVTLNPARLALMANNKGQNYNTMLANADKIIVWGYFGEDQYPPETFVQIGQFLSQLGKDRVILSIGLWGANGTTVAASDVQIAVQSSQQGGMPNLWITPYSMTSMTLWGDLTQLWGA
jgi:hypothetical protein